MKPTLKQIECFLAVADAGAFSRAAQRMNMAQPALSQAVRDLEHVLGMRLFDRTTRRVELTEAGAEFRASASRVVQNLHDAVQSLHDLADRKRGRLDIAAPPLLASVVLPKALAEYGSRYPGIQTSLVDVGTEQIVERVVTGKADCGLGTFALGTEGIERAGLGSDSLMAFCGPDDPLAASDEVMWADLGGRPIITLTRDSGIRLLVEVGFEAAEVAFSPAYEVAQITTAIALVAAGLGISVLPTYALAATNPRQVIGRPLLAPRISREIALIHARGRELSPAAAAFLPIARHYVQQLTPGYQASRISEISV